MMDKNLFFMSEILGRDDPQVRALLWAARDPAMAANVTVMMENLLREKGWDPQNLPKFFLPRSISPSDYIIGIAVSGNVHGSDIGFSEEDLDSHIGIYGQTGGGKSTLVMLLLIGFTNRDKKNRFFIWDAGDEYRRLLTFYGPDKLVWLRTDILGLNPLQVPLSPEGKPVMQPVKWIDELRELLRMLWLNEPSVNLFCEILDREYLKRGVYSDPVNAVYPSLSDILAELKNLKAGQSSDRHKARMKLIDRLGAIRKSLPGLDVQRSRNVYELFGKRSVILDVSNVRDIGRPFLFSYLCLVFRSVFYMEEPAITGMMVVEEAHEVLGGQVNKRTSDLKEAISTGFLRDIRKSGFCTAAVSQLVPDLDRSIRGNLGSVISLRQGDHYCVKEAAADLNLKPWQADKLAKLTGRKAIARFSRFGEPVNILIEDASKLFRVPKPTREQAEARSKPVLDKIAFVKSMKKKPPAENKKEPLDPASNEYKAFAFTARFPYRLAKDRQVETGLSKDADSRAVRKLRNLGMVRPGGKAGAKFQLSEPTDKGLALAKKLGLPTSAAEPHKGGVRHRCLLHYFQKLLHAAYPELSFTETGAAVLIGGIKVQPDLVIVHPDGRRWALQCCVKNSVQYETDRLLRLLELTRRPPEDPQRFERVICLAVNKGHRQSIEQAVEQQTGGSLPGSLVMRDFDEMINGVDWKDVLNV